MILHPCPNCGHKTYATPSVRGLACRKCGTQLTDGTPVQPSPPRPKPLPGVGDIVTRKLQERGYTDSVGCGCKSKARRMNEWGPDGCREHLDEIVGWLESAAKEAGWKEWIAVSTPGAKQIALAKIRALVEEAIREVEHRVALVTVHYNPLRYRRLRDTYYQWLPTLGQLADRLTCYELVFDDDAPEIEGSVVIRGTREKNLLWQKEALINHALRQQSPSVRYFGWLDHDLVFANPRWIEEAIAKIDAGSVAVQCFDRIEFLGPEGETLRTAPGGAASAQRTGMPTGSPGGAWLAERAFLDKIGGLLENNIVGGGDQAWLSALHGDAAAYHHRLSGRLADASIEWVRYVQGEAAGRFGSVTGAARHLYHGDRRHRQYVCRDAILRQHDFDPDIDIRRSAAGILEWASEKPAMHRAMQDYFEGRREDEGLR